MPKESGYGNDRWDGDWSTSTLLCWIDLIVDDKSSDVIIRMVDINASLLDITDFR